MVFVLLIRYTTSCGRILRLEDSNASYPVDGLPRTEGIVPAIGSIVQIVHQSEDGRPWKRSVQFPVTGTILS